MNNKTSNTPSTRDSALCAQECPNHLAGRPIKIQRGQDFIPSKSRPSAGSTWWQTKGRSLPAKIHTPQKSFLESSTVAGPASIAELARALKNDVDLIYEWVYSNVDFYPMWGIHKSVLGTLIDRVGAPFEQAALMVELLREAGYTADYVAGTIRLTKAQLENLLGTDDSTDPTVTEQFMIFSMIPHSATYDAGVLDYVDLAHVWVKVDIDGTEYVFDPCLKTYSYTSGIDIGNVVDYNETELIDDAEDGATVASDYIEDFNTANVRDKFKEYGTNLLDWIRSNDFDASLAEIIGGREISPLSSTPLRQTSLPYQTPSAPTTDWTEIPNDYRAIYAVEYGGTGGISIGFFTDDMYGRRLTLTFNSSTEPIVMLDGTIVDGPADALTPDAFYEVAFQIIHPAGFDTALDVSWTQQLWAPGTYFLGMTFGPVSQSMVDFHQNAMKVNQDSGGADGDEDVLGESLAMLYFLHASESNRTYDLYHWIGDGARFVYSNGGVTGFNENSQSAYIDLGNEQKTVVSRNGDDDQARKISSACALMDGAFEAAIIQQNFSVTGISTARVMETAISLGQKIFDATSSNWMSSVRSQLTNWSSSLLSDFDDDISSGERLIVNEDGLTDVDDWTGGGWHPIQTTGSGTGIGSIISGVILGGTGGSANNGIPGDNPPDYRPPEQEKTKDPIGLFTGDLFYRRTDITVGSGAYPYSLGFSRIYNSANRLSNGPLGRGWTHNFAVSIAVNSNGGRGLGELSPKEAAAAIAHAYVMIELGLNNGSSPTLTKLLIGSLSSLWLADQLTNNSVVISGGGESKGFIKLVDDTYNPPPADASTLILNGDGTFTMKSPQQEEWNFNLAGNLETYVEPAGMTVEYSYDGNDHLESVTNSLGRTLTLNYTDDLLTSVSDGNGRSVSFTVDENGDLTEFTDARGKTTVFEYASPGLLTKVYRASNPSVASIVNTYDSLGRVKTQQPADCGVYEYFFAGSRAEEVDPDGNRHIMYFNKLGAQVRDIDPLGRETTYEFDGLNRLIRMTLPEENACEYEWDENNNLLTKTWKAKPGSMLSDIVNSFTFDPDWNKVATATDGRGNTTSFEYDETTGTLLTIERPEIDSQIPTIAFTHNSRGQVETITDETGIVTKLNYDTMTEKLLSVVRDFGTSPSLNLTVGFGYNSVGDVTSVTDPRGNAWSFTFNAERRVTEIEDPSPFGFITNFDYDDDNRPTSVERETGDVSTPWQIVSMTYNLTGKLDSITDPANQTTSYQFDSLNRLWKVTDAEGRVAEFGFDELSRVADLKNPSLNSAGEKVFTENGLLESIEDALGNVTSYEYDGFDRLVKTIYPDTSYEQRTFDANGNVLTFRTRAGKVITMTFDVLNRTATRSPEDLPTETMTYDLAGRLTKVSTPVVSGDPTSGDFEFFFDSAGRLTEQHMPDGKEVVYELDENGNRTKLTYPDGYYVEYFFDELNRLTDIKLNGDTAAAAHFDYDSLSRRTELTFANGCSVEYGFEINNDLTSLIHNFVGSAVEFNYGHDAIHQIIDQEASDKRFIWTPLASVTESYASPNNLNQYPTVASVNFSYNANGCLTGDGIWTFGYDTLNRMISADDGTVSASYLYDPLNRQGQKNVDGVKERFVYDGIQRIADYDGSTDTLIRRFVFGVGLDEPLIEVSSAGDLTFIHQDRQGSVIAFTDDTGAILSRHAYGPFGEDSNLSGTAFGYSGQRFDPETGLYFSKSRYYSPRLGRFLQPDPIGYGAGMHLYSYVGDSPVTLVDPLGLAAGRMAMEIPTVEVARQPGGKSWYDVPAVGATDTDTVVEFIPFIMNADDEKPGGDSSGPNNGTKPTSGSGGGPKESGPSTWDKYVKYWGLPPADAQNIKTPQGRTDNSDNADRIQRMRTDPNFVNGGKAGPLPNAVKTVIPPSGKGSYNQGTTHPQPQPPSNPTTVSPDTVAGPVTNGDVRSLQTSTDRVAGSAFILAGTAAGFLAGGPAGAAVGFVLSALAGC